MTLGDLRRFIIVFYSFDSGEIRGTHFDRFFFSFSSEKRLKSPVDVHVFGLTPTSLARISYD